MERPAGAKCALPHPLLLHLHLFGLSGRAGGLYLHGEGGGEPFVAELGDLLAKGEVLGTAAPQFLAADVQGSAGEVADKQGACAKSLVQRLYSLLCIRGEWWQCGGPCSQCVQTAVPFECACYPIACAVLLCQANPFLCAAQSAVERGLQHQVLRTDGLEQCNLLLGPVDADEFLVESDGQGRRGAELAHRFPLSGTQGLLDAVQGELCQCFQFAGSFLGRESAVGIHPQRDAFGAEAPADGAEKFQFAVEVNGADFKFYAVKSCGQLFLKAALHFLEIPHPYQSVDGDAALSAGEGSVEEPQRVACLPCGLQAEQGGLQSKQDGGVGAQCFGVHTACAADLTAALVQKCFVVCRW